MNEYILPKELNQYVVFETMNNRGKPLSELEKLKNRLMYLVDKIKDDDPKLEKAYKFDLEKKINLVWISIYQSLGANKESPLDDEEFLKNHWIAYFQDYKKSEGKPYAKFLFKKHFTLEQLNKNNISGRDIELYVQSLQECAIILNKIEHPEYFLADECTAKSYVQGLHIVGVVNPFKPIVLAVLHNKKMDYLKIIRLLQDYAFKIYHVSDRQSNTGNEVLYRLAYEVYHSTITAELAIKKINDNISEFYSYQKFRILISELFNKDKKLT